MTTAGNDEPTFTDALEGLHRGDFSRLEPRGIRALRHATNNRMARPRTLSRSTEGAGRGAHVREFSRPHESRRAPIEARCECVGRGRHRSGRPPLGCESWTVGSGATPHQRKGSARNAKHVWRHGSRNGDLVGHQRTATRSSPDHRRAARSGCPLGRRGLPDRARAYRRHSAAPPVAVIHTYSCRDCDMRHGLLRWCLDGVSSAPGVDARDLGGNRQAERHVQV
jgi:hypothetical protein